MVLERRVWQLRHLGRASGSYVTWTGCLAAKLLRQGVWQLNYLDGGLAAKVLGQGVWKLRYLGRASGS